MKTLAQLLSAAVFSIFLFTAPTSAAEGPELKFDPETAASGAESKPHGVYGDKPLLKWGNENRYVKLGGYGSIRFEADSAEGLSDTFTFRRFVLTTDARIASRFRIYFELEFERFREVEVEQETAVEDGEFEVGQEIEGTNQSEIALEQAWFELEFARYIRFQGGGVLVPIGRFNINHDDNVWNLPRRPLVDRGVPVLPTTSAWDELGFGLNGDVELGEKAGMNYRIYVVNGATLNFQLENAVVANPEGQPELEQAAKIGISTGTFSQDIKDAKAVTGRVAFSPALGHEIGISGYWGRYTPDFLQGENLTVVGFDFLSTIGSFEVEGEWALSHFGGLDEVLQNLAAIIGESEAEEEGAALTSKIAFEPSQLVSTKQGYWIELRYRFRPGWLTRSWFGKHFSDPQLIPVVRWEQAFLNGLVTEFGATGSAVTTLIKENRRVDRITAGFAFRLNPLAVFQLAYEFTQTNQGGALAQVTNFLPTESSQNHAFLFGAAFGF
jgi:hypothetical protein